MLCLTQTGAIEIEETRYAIRHHGGSIACASIQSAQRTGMSLNKSQWTSLHGQRSVRAGVHLRHVLRIMAFKCRVVSSEGCHVTGHGRAPDVFHTHSSFEEPMSWHYIPRFCTQNPKLTISKTLICNLEFEPLLRIYSIGLLRRN